MVGYTSSQALIPTSPTPTGTKITEPFDLRHVDMSSICTLNSATVEKADQKPEANVSVIDQQNHIFIDDILTAKARTAHYFGARKLQPQL